MWTLLTIVVLIVVWCALAYCINNTITKPREAKRKLLEAQRDLAAQKRRLLEEQAANKIEKYNKLIEETEILKAQADELKKYHTEKVLEIDKYVKEKCDSYSHMAVIMSDLLTSHYEESAKILETKRNPAPVEANRIRELREETVKILRQKTELEYRVEYLRQIFPNIDVVFESDIKETPTVLEISRLISEIKNTRKNLKAIVLDQIRSETTNEIRDKFFVPIKSRLDRIYDFDGFYLAAENGKINKAFESDLSIWDFQVSAQIKSGDNVYNVSLTHCECKDFEIHRKPCKHILFLAYTLGVLQTNQERCTRHKETLVEKIISLNDTKSKLDQEVKFLSEKVKKSKGLIKAYDQTNADMEQALQMKVRAYPYFAKVIADQKTMHFEEATKSLLSKRRPAFKEARRITELKKETRAILEKSKVLEYKLAYIEEMFPNINDIFDFENATSDFELETDENTDRVRYYLSHEEYAQLSVSEKNQLALDRYIEGRKSKWQIGRDYEIYIGYLCEKEGFSVSYTGVIKKLEDMGRDLIVNKDNAAYVIQCKNWSQRKIIHEKHIFQLFGSVVEYNLDHRQKAQGVFVTTTELSPMAVKVAKELNIHVVHIEMGNFPRIKCNIGKSGEKIYHLPFDQQYDKVVVDATKGECYTFSVKDAEAKGFRRACKYFAQQKNSPA